MTKQSLSIRDAFLTLFQTWPRYCISFSYMTWWRGLKSALQQHPEISGQIENVGLFDSHPCSKSVKYHFLSSYYGRELSQCSFYPLIDTVSHGTSWSWFLWSWDFIEPIVRGFQYCQGMSFLFPGHVTVPLYRDDTNGDSSLAQEKDFKLPGG